MSIYTQLGVRTIINAADSYTILGGSLLPPEVVKAMEEASRHFVYLDHLHDEVGKRMAQLTRNEAAMVTNGAAAGLAISVVACITGDDRDKITEFPALNGMKSEVIVHRCQRNNWEHVIGYLGVQLVEIGDEDSTMLRQLEEAITEQTACIVYFTSQSFDAHAIPLQDVISIGKKHNIPVIVDAAAQLPPVHNLWTYTGMGADLVIFSGGKTLRGPQSSGLVVGKSELIRACRLNSNPNMSVGRPMKVGKEEMVGLLTAIDRYVHLDHEAQEKRYIQIAKYFCEENKKLGFDTEFVDSGPTGQSYPRAAIYLKATDGKSAEQIVESLKNGNPSIWTRLTENKQGFYINPLHLQDEEIRIVQRQIENLLFGPTNR